MRGLLGVGAGPRRSLQLPPSAGVGATTAASMLPMRGDAWGLFSLRRDSRSRPNRSSISRSRAEASTGLAAPNGLDLAEGPLEVDAAFGEPMGDVAAD